MKKLISTSMTFTFIITIMLFSACSDKQADPVAPIITNFIQDDELVTFQESPREPETITGLAEADLMKATDVNPDDYSLILRDNENYYYFLNQKTAGNSRYYLGEAYFKASSYYYRGECKLINQGNESLALRYIDSRYNQAILIAVRVSNNRGTLYFEPKDKTWIVSMTFHNGSL